MADDAAWANAQELVIPVAGGFNNFGTDAKLRAVYSGDTVYFVLTYADPTESWFRSPFILKAHTQNIYNRLDVHSRIEAINKAREMDLL